MQQANKFLDQDSADYQNLFIERLNDSKSQYTPFPPFSTTWTSYTNTWTEGDWRIVGSKKRSMSVCETKPQQNRRSSEPFMQHPVFGEAFYLTTTKKFEKMDASDILSCLTDTLYIIEYNSKRLDIAYVSDDMCYEIGQYVIIEADRGEDCGIIIQTATKEKYRQLLNKIDEITKEVQPKRIFRKALSKDMESFYTKEIKEREALYKCKEKVIEKNLEMNIVKCEFQWDMHKLTFFFHSDKRVDFRDLVKELYKEYKVRIWMCAVDKSKNAYLRELI